MLRVVLDTSLIVAALRSRTGAANAILRAVANEQLRPLATTALYLEYEAVLLRPEHLGAHGLTPSEIDRFLAAFASACEPVDLSFRWRPQLADPGDEMILEAAANGRADAIATYNLRDFAGAAQRFGVRVLTSGQLLEELRL